MNVLDARLRTEFHFRVSARQNMCAAQDMHGMIRRVHVYTKEDFGRCFLRPLEIQHDTSVQESSGE